MIYGLFVNETPLNLDPITNRYSTRSAGLFPVVSKNTIIRNVHIRDSYISGAGNAGSVVGKIDENSYCKVLACSADESVTLKGQVAGGIIGGGASREFKIYYCYFTGSVSSTVTNRANALVGDSWGATWEMLQCYFVGYNACNTLAAAKPTLSGANYGSVAMAFTKYLTVEQMTGTVAKNNMKLFEWDTVWQTVKNDTPHPKVVAEDKQGDTQHQKAENFGQGV
jgi:hypothetical protein